MQSCFFRRTLCIRHPSNVRPVRSGHRSCKFLEMSEPISDTRQCPHCGVVNASSRALCINCQSPLTAYAGELQGESYQGKLAEQAAHAEIKPWAVTAMAVCDVLFAVFWPIAFVIGAYTARAHVNVEGTNYAAAAFGSLVPLFYALTLLPIAALLCFVAWGAWAQRTWAWAANAWTIGAFVFVVFIYHRVSFLTFICVCLAGGLAYAWYLPRTRAWFGISAN